MVFKVPFTFKVYSPFDDSAAAHTYTYWESSDDSIYTFGVFFEIVSPLLDLKAREILVQRFWQEFKERYSVGHKFDKALESAFRRLQEELDNLSLKEGIDANIVVFSTEPTNNSARSIEDESRTLKIAVVGAVDIYLIRGTKYSDLMEYLDVNTDINNIQYNELDIKYGDLLLISNKGILQNLFYGGFIDVSGIESILYSLEQQRGNINAGKRVLSILFAELDLSKLQYGRGRGSPLGNPLKVVFDNLDRIVGSVHSVIIYIKEKLKRITAVGNRSNISIRGIATRGAKFQSRGIKTDEQGMTMDTLYKNEHGASIEEEVVVLGDKSGDNTVLSDSKQSPLGSTNRNSGISKEERYISSVSQDNIEGEAGRGVVTASGVGVGDSSYTQDPVEYLRNRRRSTYRFKARFVGLVGKVLGWLPLRKFRSGATRQRTWGKLAGPLVIGGRDNKFNLYLYATIGLVVFVLVFVRVKKARMNKYDTHLIEEFKKEYYVPLRDIYENKVRRLLAGDPQGDISACFKQYSKLSQAYDSYKINLKVKTNIPKLEGYLKEAQNIRQKCEDKYYEVYNIERLSTNDLELVKDFKVALGDQSNVVSIDIYQGVIMLLDAGKKAVYKLNQENGSITKVEINNSENLDGYFRDIAIGTETFFVCVAQEGVFYYRQSSKELRLITGTELANLGGNCNSIDTYAKNVYIVTELGDGVYKVPGLGGLQYTTPSKYLNYDGGQVVDFSIDGSIFVLVSSQEGGYDILRYFNGRFDSAFRLEDNFKARLIEPTVVYTNPSGYMPLYVYDRKDSLLYIVEKPTRDKHPGVGTLIKTYKLPDEIGKVVDLAVLLSVNNNREKAVYILTDDNRLYKLEL